MYCLPLHRTSDVIRQCTSCTCYSVPSTIKYERMKGHDAFNRLPHKTNPLK